VSALAVQPTSLPPALPGPYADPPAPDALQPHPATIGLVRGVVRELLVDTPEFRALGTEDRVKLAHNLVRVASYLAECVRDDWYQSGKLEQRPLIRTQTPLATAQATAGQIFEPAAASQIGRVTTETLRAISFPTFVADLIRGTFNAIGDASQKQMESYMELLTNVSKTVDEFTQENVSDDMARGWLAEKYPRHIQVGQDGKAAPAAGQPEGGGPDFVAELDLTSSVDASDASAIEDTLVPAARRKLAQTRLKMLSSLVLMGINRIVVTGGKIRATMGFHINTRDTAHAESASMLDTRVGASGSFAWGPFGVSASMSVAYVSSTKADSNAELNTQTDLTGEVELHFMSDYFPISRFAESGDIDKIRANTPVPAANIPWGDTSPPRPVEPMGPLRQPSQTPFQALPPSPVTTPTPPTPPDVLKQQEEQRRQQSGAQPPATGAQTPATGAQTPATGAQTPTTGTQTHTTGAQTPTTGTPTPATGAQTPATGAQTPQPAPNAPVSPK
jgi:hypothetical protein